MSTKITKLDRNILGSLAIDGTTYRLTDEQIEEHTVQQLFDVVDEIEAEFG